jgi:hypothetical protein
MVESVDFRKRYFATFFEESPMSNRISMDITQGITLLFLSGMSQVARALGIDRKSVARELRRSGGKGATDGKPPTWSAADNKQQSWLSKGACVGKIKNGPLKSARKWPLLKLPLNIYTRKTQSSIPIIAIKAQNRFKKTGGYVAFFAE